MEVVPICLVCLKRVENSRDHEYFNEEATHSEKKDIHVIWKFLKFVNQHLRGGVDVGGDDYNPLFSNLKFEKCSKGNVREADVFCKSCEGLISTVCQLYLELLQAQLRLSWKLSELGKLLQGSREATSNKLLTDLIKSVGRQLSTVLEGEVKDSHVKEFRLELELECSKKGKDILPQVSVDRGSLPQAFQEGGGVDRGGTTWPLVLWITQDADESGKTIEGLWNVDVKSEVSDSDDWEDTTYQRPSSSWELLKDKEDSIKLEIEIGQEDECPSDSNGSQLEESRKDKGTCILKCPEPAINILPNTLTRRKTRANAVCVATSICEDDENDKIEAQTDNNFDNVNDQSRKDPVTGKGLKLDSNNIDVKCDHCDKVFSSRSRFLDHLRRVERRKTSNCSFHCCFCWRSFFYRQSHEMHMTSTSQSQHKILMKSNAPFLCSDLSCRKWFSSLTEHNEHLKDHSDVINQCPNCGLGFINRSHLELHQLLHTKPTGMSLNSLGRVQCLACSKEFGKMEQFQEHFNTEHGSRLKFDCEKCGIDFKSFLALCVHMKTDLHLPPKVVVPKASAEKKNKKALKKYDYSCEACGKLFTKLHTLQCHLRHFHEYKAKVEEKIFRCCFCVRSFAFSQSCAVHMQEMHKNKIVEKAFQCDEDGCKAAFENLDKLKHHLSTHDSSSTSKFFECKECKWPFLNSKRLQLHELSHIPRINGVFNCPFPNCKPVFLGVEHFQSHFNIRHGDKLKMFKCLVENCEVACCTMSAIKIHMRSHPEKEESSRPFRCPDCGRRYKDERLLNRCHRTWYHKPKRECPKCGEKFRWTRELWKHMRDKHTEVRERNGSGPKMERKKKELTLLSRKRKDWNGMGLLTTKRKKSKEVNPLLPIKPKEVNLIPRKPKKVKVNQLPTNRKKQAEKPVNPCPVCGKPIKGSLISPQMTKHLRTHQRVKERRVFICESCGRLFTTRRYLKLHIERHEKKTTPTEILCHLCGKRLSSLRGLELHKTAAHSNRKNHCNICSKYFASTTGFKSHMELFHENRDDEQSQDQSETPTTTVSYKKRMCYYPSCKSIFKNQLNLQSHVEQMHSISSESQFMCNLCGRTFVNRKRLSRHSVFHTGEKPHKCEICGNAFSQRSSLKAHLANMHGQGHKNQESYPCGQPNCKKTFKCNDYLKKHLLKVHKLRSGGGIATNLNTSVVETVSNNGEDKN